MKPFFLFKFHSLKDVLVGGQWKPTLCIPRHRVAIVVPFRNRHQQLSTFLSHMIPFLQKQSIHFGIYIVDQQDKLDFNRAGLFNIGFVEALKDSEWDCVIFHDVDLLPEDDRNLYTCPEFNSPRHMSVGKRIFVTTLRAFIQIFII